MTILAVDAGNSRIKWGLHDGQGWLRQGVADTGQVAALAEDWRELAAPRKIVVSNVAGAPVQAALQQLFAPWRIEPHWVAAQANQCGVSCGYVDPAQLGPDRWAALVAARRYSAEACLVVNVGTAVTVDALSRAGLFLGGLILPGIALMADALARGTAGVRAAGGRFARFPASTADAVHSGALQAIAGAAERMALELDAHEAGQCLVVLSGGGARELAPLLHRPVKELENLVLEGLVVIAQERGLE